MTIASKLKKRVIEMENGMKFTRSKEFRLIKESELPCLFLGLNITCDFDFDGKRFVKYPGLRWQKIFHQTAGHGCHHHYLWGTKLPPRNPSVAMRMRALSNKWFESDTGVFQTSLDDFNEYRRDALALFGVDCNHEFHSMEEGLYPLECTRRSLARMTSASLPEDLDTLIKFKNNMMKVLGIIGRWNLCVLGKNCD